MATRTILKEKKYRIKVEFWVNVDAPHAVKAEQEGWDARMVIGEKHSTPEFVEVECLEQY